jgi:hypothetical protein
MADNEKPRQASFSIALKDEKLSSETMEELVVGNMFANAAAATGQSHSKPQIPPAKLSQRQTRSIR